MCNNSFRFVNCFTCMRTLEINYKLIMSVYLNKTRKSCPCYIEMLLQWFPTDKKADNWVPGQERDEVLAYITYIIRSCWLRRFVDVSLCMPPFQ